MRKKNFKKGPFVYRRTLTLADKKKGSKPSSSSAQRNRRLMHYFLHGTPSKQRRDIVMLLAVCVFVMALGTSFHDIFSEELGMDKRKT